MLLSIEEIKKGICHPEVLVRELALHHFTDSWSADPSIMPLAVEAIRQFNWKEALDSDFSLERLPQTPEALSWLIEELEKTKPSPREAALHEGLWGIVSSADVGLLRPHEDRLLRIAGDIYHRKIQDRLQFANLDSAECWRQMEAFCEAEKDTPYLDGASEIRANCLIEGISRDLASVDRVTRLLEMNIDDRDGNPLALMEGIAVGIAGKMRLNRAIPLLIAKLGEDVDDWVTEETVKALSMIGGDEVAEAIERKYELSWHFRLYGASILSANRGSETPARALRLYETEIEREGEENGLMLTYLLQAGLNNFAPEAVERARGYFRIGNDRCLRESIVAAATLLGISFPELQDWTNQSRNQRREIQRNREEWLNWRPAPSRNELAPPRATRESAAPAETVGVTKPFHAVEKVGRNDPCPCGSGKKYKKCCMNGK